MITKHSFMPSDNDSLLSKAPLRSLCNGVNGWPRCKVRLRSHKGFGSLSEERLSFDEGPVVIEDYGYELWHKGDKIAWYDAQPHPDDSAPYPHHKHISPEIKHQRIPAPNMSFTRPNLPALIREIEALLEE